MKINHLTNSYGINTGEKRKLFQQEKKPIEIQMTRSNPTSDGTSQPAEGNPTTPASNSDREYYLNQIQNSGNNTHAPNLNTQNPSSHEPENTINNIAQENSQVSGNLQNNFLNNLKDKSNTQFAKAINQETSNNSYGKNVQQTPQGHQTPKPGTTVRHSKPSAPPPMPTSQNNSQRHIPQGIGGVVIGVGQTISKQKPTIPNWGNPITNGLATGVDIAGEATKGTNLGAAFKGAGYAFTAINLYDNTVNTINAAKKDGADAAIKTGGKEFGGTICSTIGGYVFGPAGALAGDIIGQGYGGGVAETGVNLGNIVSDKNASMGEKIFNSGNEVLKTSTRIRNNSVDAIADKWKSALNFTTNNTFRIIYGDETKKALDETGGNALDVAASFTKTIGSALFDSSTGRLEETKKHWNNTKASAKKTWNSAQKAITNPKIGKEVKQAQKRVLRPAQQIIKSNKGQKYIAKPVRAVVQSKPVQAAKNFVENNVPGGKRAVNIARRAYHWLGF